MKIKYNNSETLYNISDYQIINDYRIRLFGEELIENLSGFELYDEEDNLVLSCLSHNTLYDIGKGFIEYTTDTTVFCIYYLYNSENYVTEGYRAVLGDTVENGVLMKQGQGKEYAEDKYLHIGILDEDGIYNYKVVDGKVVELTENEKLAIKTARETASFLSNKEQKIANTKVLLADYLTRHPLVSKCHNGVEATYNVTSEKQNLMTSHYATYTIEKELGLNPILKWNSTGAECEIWTEEEFVQLILEIKAYVEPLVSLQQSYEVRLQKCTNQEELDNIDVVYDVYGIAE